MVVVLILVFISFYRKLRTVLKCKQGKDEEEEILI